MNEIMKDDFFGAVLNCAVRYSLGRVSYMPGLVMDEIRPMLPSLSPKTLSCFERDIQKWLRGGGQTNPYWRDWAAFLTAVRNAQDRPATERADGGGGEATGGLILFSSRRKLAGLFEGWAKENGVAESPEGVIAYLAGHGLLNVDKVKQFLVENCQDNE